MKNKAGDLLTEGYISIWRDLIRDTNHEWTPGPVRQ